MSKSNPMLRKLELKYELEYALLFRQKMDILIQMMEDCAVIAAHEALGMGKGRAEKFLTALRDAVNELSALTVEDGKDDKELLYTKDKLDERLRAIVGDELFRNWDDRYRNKKTPDNR